MGGEKGEERGRGGEVFPRAPLPGSDATAHRVLRVIGQGVQEVAQAERVV